MTTNIQSTPAKLDVQVLMTIQGDRTKFWWNCSMYLQLGIIALSAYSTLTQNLTTETTLVLIPILSMITPLIRWRADFMKGQYQSLLRKFEFSDGLGWPITTREKSEWLLQLSKEELASVTKSNQMPQNYFASSKQPSPARLLENLEESSWWSAHLARFMAIVVGCATFAVLLVSLAILMVTIQGAANQASLTNVAKVIISVISALFSLGFVRMAVDYWAFSASSTKFEEKACTILDSTIATNISHEEATKLLHEYQLARAGAPMIPNWVWERNEKQLNLVWKQERTRT